MVGTPVILQYDLRRVRCPNCSDVFEAVPWANSPESPYTKQFEEEATRVAGSPRQYCELLGALRSAFPR